MRYLVVACDYDGTLAHDGRVSHTTVEALARLKATGRRLILVTGRELDDLRRVFDRLDLFDRVVAENGAVLYAPASGEMRPLVPPPPPEFVQLLRRKGVSPLSVGHAIVATWVPHETSVLEAIRDLGLEYQVVFNKGAVMALPTGVNKGTGLSAALEDLGLSPHNCVSVGDAENDHAFLTVSECAVAVANALPALKQTADWVTDGAGADGVGELIARLVESDLGHLGGHLQRHELVIGSTSDGTEVRLAPYCCGIMIAGPSGSGKSTITTTILERLAASGYQFCLIDPEGDYQEFEPAIGVRGGGVDVMIDEALDVLTNPANNVVINLLDVETGERPLFFERFFPRLQALRAGYGRPHWIVVDEVHHFVPAEWTRAPQTFPPKTHGLLMITVNPAHVAPGVSSLVDVAIALGHDADHTIASIARAADTTLPQDIPADLSPGEAVLWRLTDGAMLTRFTLAAPESQRRRHRKKYAEGEIADYRSFYFRGADGRLNLKAHNLGLFVQMAEGVDDETWTFHLRQHDYSRWFRKVIKDQALATEADLVENDDTASPHESRARIFRAIADRYTAPA